jgi:hypothetical protein
MPTQSTDERLFDYPRHPGESDQERRLQFLVDEIFELRHDQQHEFLRRVIPDFLADLHGEARESFAQVLREEVAKALAGEPSYDVRPHPPSAY